VFGLVWTLLPVALLCVGIVPARAAGPRSVASDSVSFLRRDYDLRIQPSGDVAVTERWKVHFTGGPFTNASLGVFLSHAGAVAFQPIDGADSGSERVATLVDSQKHEVQQISWTFPATRDAERAFTITYTLRQAIGQNSTQAWLDRHLFDGPGRSTYPVGAMRVTVTLPAAASGGDVQVRSAYPGAQLQVSRPSATTVQLDGQNLNAGNLLEVAVIFPRNLLESSAPRPAWQKDDAPPNPPTALDTVTSVGSDVPTSNTNPVATFLGNIGLVLAAGLIVIAILGLIAWRLTKRLSGEVQKLAAIKAEGGATDGEAVDGDGEPALPLATKPLPAIDLDFGQVEWPKQQEQLDLDALGLHPLEMGRNGPISRIGYLEDDNDGDSGTANETPRGTSATSGVGGESEG
jgi:hypothetical protein